MAEKINFTKAWIDRHPAVEKGVKYQDAQQPGLMLRIGKRSRTWHVYRWCPVERRPRRIRIGPWPSWTVAAARTRARELVAEIDKGEASKSKIPTLREAVAAHTAHLTVTSTRHPRYLEKIVSKGCTDWLNRSMDGITKIEIVERHNRIAEVRGNVAAAQWVKVLRTVFRHSLDGYNPAQSVRIKDSRPRSRILTPTELSRLRSALADEGGDVEDYFLLSLFTGARRSNVASMRWSDIDVQECLWIIAAESSKNGFPMVVPLIGKAIEILRRRRYRHDIWVFPSAKAASGHLQETWCWWDRVRKAARLDGVTQHDLRRTTAAMLVAAGAPLTVTAAALGHRSPATTARVYAIPQMTNVKAALEKAINAYGDEIEP